MVLAMLLYVDGLKRENKSSTDTWRKIPYTRKRGKENIKWSREGKLEQSYMLV